ncbi:MAG: protein kinase [Pseudomonadota bacterium]
MTSTQHFKQIDRYTVTGELGKGSQGVVLLAQDGALEREVAVKVLHHQASEKEKTRLIDEARIVCQLRHPNVVTLLDYGLIEEQPYLVFERLQGHSLRDHLEQNGALGIERSVVLMSQILGGVAAAHALDVAHCDLSPNNIILTQDGFPKVMDFGLSSITTDNDDLSHLIAGTPPFMSPEHLLSHQPGLASDVFSLGAILFQMLTGERHFDQTDRARIFQAIKSGDTRLPSSVADNTPEVLDQIVERALARKPEERYTDAKEMKTDLDRYRVPRGVEEPRQHGTVEFLLRRLKFTPGFSAFSQRIQEVIRITSSTREGDAQRLASLLARDITLTQKVLSMANSAYYGGQQFSSLSRAIAWLGMDQVRDCVTSCLLNSQFKDASEQLRLEQLLSFCNAFLAKQMAKTLSTGGTEDTFLAGLFHNLGKMLVVHYLSEEYAVINSLITASKTEDECCREVLDIGYPEIGQQVGRSWNLPDQILDAMLPGQNAEHTGRKVRSTTTTAIVQHCAVLNNIFANGDDPMRVLSKMQEHVGIEDIALVELLNALRDAAVAYIDIIAAHNVARDYLSGIEDILAESSEPRLSA